MDSEFERRLGRVFQEDVDNAPNLSPPDFPELKPRSADMMWWIGSAAAAVLAFVLVLEGPPPGAARLVDRPGTDRAIEHILARVNDGVAVIHQAYFADNPGDQEDL